jgi:carbamoyltransferase
MITLGIHAYTHDSAAAIVKDGRILAAVEEERFNGTKHSDAFPEQAIGYCLQAAGVDLQQVDIVAVSWAPFYQLGHRILSLVRHFPKSLEGLKPSRDRRIRGNLDLWSAIHGIPRKILQTFGRAPGTRFIFYRHHDCHAASAYYVSPFKRAAILTCDACGEWDTTVYYRAMEDRIEQLACDRMPNSLGLIYGAFTQYLGFQEKCDEGKVMALAAMADPVYLNQMKQVFRLNGKNGLTLDQRYFKFQYSTKNKLYSQALIDLFGPPPAAGNHPPLISRQIAASVQTQCEEVLIGMIHRLTRESGLRDICIAGGVALNSKANGRLLEQGVLDRLFVQPAANDAGTALGAALLAHIAQGATPINRVAFSPYLGPEAAPAQCRQAVSGRALHCREVTAPARVAAGLLAAGQVIGWHQGRMEWGPRALGNRSILADPRDPQMKDRVNARVKFREAFRPFAPAILAEAQKDYFRCAHPVPHMTHVLTVRENMAERIPAAVHVDGTARLQSVGHQDNTVFSELIRSFGTMTGVPVVLNTSLNVQGMPIAAWPEQSLACLEKTDLDFLVLGSLVLCKTEEKKRLLTKVMGDLQ